MNFANTYQENDKESLDRQQQLGSSTAGTRSYDALYQASTSNTSSMLGDPKSDAINSFGFSPQYQHNVY